MEGQITPQHGHLHSANWQPQLIILEQNVYWVREVLEGSTKGI